MIDCSKSLINKFRRVDWDLIRYQRIAVIFLLIFHAGLSWHSAVQESATVDELSHLATGLYAWETGDFRLSRATPPLQNMVCALPVALFFDPKLSFDNQCWRFGIWNGLGTSFVKENPDNFHKMLVCGRMASIALSALLCFLIFHWARVWWGTHAALVVLVFAALEPNLIAHGKLTTTDTSAALGFVLAGYCLDRLLRHYSQANLLLLGVAFGLSWYAKHSGSALLAALLVAVVAHKASSLDKTLLNLQAWREILFSSLKVIAVVLTVGLFVIWAGYGFEIGETIDPPPEPYRYELWRSVSFIAQSALNIVGSEYNLVAEDNDPNNLLWRWIRRGLPAFSHWEGFFDTQVHLRMGHLGFFLGALSSQGWKLYYPILFLVKTPPALLLIYLLGLTVLFGKKVSFDRNRLAAALCIPVLYLLTLVFYNTANIGYRHALPIVPFLLIFLAGPAAQLLLQLLSQNSQSTTERVKKQLLAGLLLAWYAVDVLSIHPHYLEYFNLLAGGSKNGHLIAVDSNLDWGQDLFFIEDYFEEKGVEDAYLVYFGPEELPNAYGVPHRKVGTMPSLQPGVYVITATASKGIGTGPLLPLLSPLLSRPPDDYITPAVFVYRVQ